MLSDGHGPAERHQAAVPAEPSRILSDSDKLSLSALISLEYMRIKGANKYEKNGIVTAPAMSLLLRQERERRTLDQDDFETPRRHRGTIALVDCTSPGWK